MKAVLVALMLSGLLTACSELVIVQPAPVSSPSPPGPTAPARPEEAAAPLPGLGLPVAAPPARRPAPARLIIPAIGLDTAVTPMDWRVEYSNGQAISEWNVPDDTAGWHVNSARPGEGSNVVISGHNNSTGGRVFGRLDEVAEGDKIIIKTADGTEYIYRVTERQIVRIFAASNDTLDYVRQVTTTTEEEQLTLLTCWPNWSNTHRLIVIARPVPETAP